MPTDAPAAAPCRVWLANDSPLEAAHTLSMLSRVGYQLEAHADGASLLDWC